MLENRWQKAPDVEMCGFGREIRGKQGMVTRFFFFADSVSVTRDEVSVGNQIYPVTHITEARCQRQRIRWLWPFPVHTFALMLVTTEGEHIRALTTRNAYFMFQLVNAIQAAMAEAAEPQHEADWAENSSA